MIRTVQLFRLLGILAALILLSGCDVTTHRANKTIAQQVSHRDYSPLRIETSNGSIDLRSDASVSEVQIEATISAGGTTRAEAEERLEQVSIDVDRDTNGLLRISATFPEPPRNLDGVSFVVRVPNAENVTLQSSNGKLIAHGISGDLKLTTSNGAIEVADHLGDAELRTSNGRITIARHTGDAAARTSNGRIEAHDMRGSLRANTSNGRIEVRLSPDQPGPLDLRTSNGAITAEVGPAFAGVMSLSTRNGSITVRDEGDRLASREIDRRRGTLTFAEEGAASTLQTSNGRITVTMRP